MYPILYETVTTGSVPSHYGLGVLSDCLSCEVTEERNGGYELAMEYPASGIHASDLITRRIIKAKPNFTDEPQLFRIYKIGKTINGKFTVYAQHISYDLGGVVIESGTADSAQATCLLFENATTGYTFYTDKTTSATFKVDVPSSVRSWFAGKEGSFLDVFGGAEIKYNNFDVSFLNARGEDRGVTIRYGKNLTQLTQELSGENLCTHIIPYYVDQDNHVTIGAETATGLILDVPRKLAIDFTSDFDETPTVAQLNARAASYITDHILTTLINNIKLNFAQGGDFHDRVDLCDTVTIYYEALGLTGTAKCIKTKWDVLEERYISTEFGNPKTDLADTILSVKKTAGEAVTHSLMQQAVSHATALITGNLGGYVVLHDSDGNGEPDEILIMDTPDINTATKVWRWNASGLGYSSTGYDGDYGTAITADGAIVANFITAGTMSGNRIRTGIIESMDHSLVMDLDNGTISAPAITLNGTDVGDRLNDLEQTSVETAYALSNSGTTIPSTFPLTEPTAPTVAQPYLWSRTVYTYADGDVNTSYAVSVRGANGQNGADGAGLQILGNYDSMQELIQDHPTGSAGNAYMVGTDLVVWNTQTSSWQNVGRIQGPSGSDGLWLAIENNDTGTNANVTYTAHLMQGPTTDVTSTYEAIFVWYLVTETGITELASDTPTVTVSRASAGYGAAVRCVCTAVIDEENLQDYTYNDISDYTNNVIQIIGSNNIGLIGENALYKQNAVSSQFQVLSDEISSKVEQTDFDTLSGTVTTQGTQIIQNANAITLKADQTTVNGKMNNDMSNRSSSITIGSGQIVFNSNSLVVNSSKFSLDASGNASFGGNLSAPTGKVGGWTIGSSSLYADYTNGSTIYRAYYQTPLASEGDNTWIFSTQKSTNSGQTFTGLAYIKADGSARFQKFIGSIDVENNVNAKALHTGKGVYFDDTGGLIYAQANQQLYLRANTELNYAVWLGVTQNGSGLSWSFHPGYSGNLVLGTANYKWSIVYADNGTIQTSDRNLKKNIEALANNDKWEQFFDRLIPTSYMFKKRETDESEKVHDRTHIGFIAQDIEDAMSDLGMSGEDFGGFCKDDMGDGKVEYSLRYSEFIALNTMKIQKLQNEVDELKAMVNTLVEEINRLKEDK